MDEEYFLPIPYSIKPEYVNIGTFTKGIIVSEFPEQTTIEELCIRFSVYGSIKDCYLYSDSNEYRRAYITFCEAHHAVRARTSSPIYLHGKMLKLRFNLKNSRELQVHLGNHPGNTSINVLNDDILLQIFGYLSVTERFKLRKVCRRWCIITNMSLEKAQYLDLGIHLNKSATGYRTRRGDGRRLQESLRNWSKVQLPSEKSLLHSTDPITSSLDLALKLHLLAMVCRNLTKLIIRSSTSDEHILSHILTINHKLRHITIYANEHITGESLIHLPENIHTLILENCSNLQTIHVCAALKRLKNLKCLRLYSDTYRCGYEVLNVFKEHCKNLESLQLDLCDSSEDEDPYALLSITNLQSLRYLKTSSMIITDIFLVKLSKNCQELSHLEIECSNGFREMGMNAISVLPKLKVLVVKYLPFLFGFTNLRRLRKLDCTFSDIREQQIATIIQNLPELRYLCLQGCEKITANILNIISANRRNDIALEVSLDKEIIPEEKCIIYNGEIY